MIVCRAAAHALVQALPLFVETVATNRSINLFAVLLLEVIPIRAKICVCLKHMHQLPSDEFEDDDIIKITNDWNVIRKYVLGVREIYERCKQSFAIVGWQAPLIISEHLNHRLECGNALFDEIRQRFVAANFVENVPNRFDDFGLFGVPNRAAGLFECLAKKLQIAVRELERKL